jgi:hypothetical protein
MRAKLSSYALVGIEAVPVEVIVDVDRVKVAEARSRRVLHSVTLLDTTSPEGSVPKHAVNSRTLSQGRSAPARIITALICPALRCNPVCLLSAEIIVI